MQDVSMTDPRHPGIEGAAGAGCGHGAARLSAVWSDGPSDLAFPRRHLAIAMSAIWARAVTGSDLKAR